MIFLFVAGTHYLIGLGNRTLTDSVMSLPTAMSIIREGNTDLDEYDSLLKVISGRGTDILNDHTYSEFPVGVSLIEVPYVFAVDRTHAFWPRVLTRGVLSKLDLNENFKEGTLSGIYYLEKMIAAQIIALSAVFMFLTGRLFLDKKYSLLLAAIFAFCTSAWSVGSRNMM